MILYTVRKLLYVYMYVCISYLPILSCLGPDLEGLGSCWCLLELKGVRDVACDIARILGLYVYIHSNLCTLVHSVSPSPVAHGNKADDRSG